MEPDVIWVPRLWADSAGDSVSASITAEVCTSWNGGWGERGLLDGALSLFPASSYASNNTHICAVLYGNQSALKIIEIGWDEADGTTGH